MDEFKLGDSLSSRTISGFPLSIGTSIAFESIFESKLVPYDDKRTIPNKIDITQYEEIFINIFTLFRNIIGSIKKETFLNSSEEELKDVLITEIDVINSLLNNEGYGICVPTYYYNTYDNLFNRYKNKHILFRTDNTEYQKIYKSKLLKTLMLLNKETDQIVSYDSSIKPKNKSKSIILSHVPYDLVSYKNFNKLELIESHTGKLKTRFEWFSKYYPINGIQLNNIPFTRKLLLVFGDKILIHPSDIRLRRLIVDIASNKNWNALTTEDKIEQDFRLEIKEPYVLEFLSKL